MPFGSDAQSLIKPAGDGDVAALFPSSQAVLALCLNGQGGSQRTGENESETFVFGRRCDSDKPAHAVLFADRT